MSLLMQALKKAERAKQNHVPDEELAKPSEAFDEMLAPHEGLTLEPAQPLSLSPLDVEEPQAEPPSRPARNSPPPPRAARPRQRPAAFGTPDARTIRVAALAGVVLLIGAAFGYMVWRAMYGPGSSRNLPMVPMPGLNNSPPVATAPPANVLPPVETARQPYVAAAEPAVAAPPAAAPVVAAPVPIAPPPPPAASDGEEVRRIAQENLERAERMDRMLNMNSPGRPPAAPYVPPASAGAPPPSAGAPPPSAAAPPMPASAPVDAGPIHVARSSTLKQVPAALSHGYAAFNAGDFATARQQYQAMLQQDPNNRDALLGMAAIALRERQRDQAAGIYVRLLETDPNDQDALAGLAGMRQGDPSQTEGRLRRALAAVPESAPLLFALGNLYARQGRWPEAQQQYFKAYTSAPENADYAFNLAVGLDRLGKSQLALTYYQRALALSPAGATGFHRGAAQARVRELGGS